MVNSCVAGCKSCSERKYDDISFFSMASRWDTKEDVLKDLEAVAAGQRVAEIDDDYFIYGEQAPPPRHYNDEDDDIELHFGRNAATDFLAGGENSGPDLRGITQMLRMIQKYEDSSDEESIVTPKKGIIISKGNFNKLATGGISKTNGSSLNLETSKKLAINGKKYNDEIIENSSSNIQENRNKIQQIANNLDINDVMKPTGAIPKLKCPNKVVLNGKNDNQNIEKAMRHGIANSTHINAMNNINKVPYGDSTIEVNDFAYSNRELSPVKVNISNGTIISKLNPNVSEFVITEKVPLKKSKVNSEINELSNENVALNCGNHGKIINAATFSSKLNPYVKEFIPRSSLTKTNLPPSSYNANINDIVDSATSIHQNSSYGNHLTISNVCIENNSKSANLKLESIPKNESYEVSVSSSQTSNQTINSTDKSESQIESKTYNKNDPYSKDEKKRIAMMLKNQIVATNDTFEEQRKTNKAIFKLLQLYAEPKPPVKLLTPEFFENTHEPIKKTQETVVVADSSIEHATHLHCVNEVCDIKLTDQNKKDLEAIENLKKPDVTELNSQYNNDDDAFAEPINKNDNLSYLKNDNAICTHDVDESNETKLTPEFEDIHINASNPDAEPLDPYTMKESIDKVNNWLNDKPVVDKDRLNVQLKTIQKQKKPSSPVLNLGAVAYKRKDPVTCKSPLSEIADKKISKSDIPEFKPSSYAGELHKKYTERNKVATPTPKLNIWDKLEADLKARDLEIKNRKKET